MSRRYTNKELRESLIVLDRVLFDILSNAYEYMEIIDQAVKKIKNKTDDTPISEHSLRQMNASAQTIGLINFLVHPAHETSKRYFPNSIKQIDEFKSSSDKAFEAGLTVCYCETQCDPGKIRLKKIIADEVEKIKAQKADSEKEQSFKKEDLEKKESNNHGESK